MLPSGCQHSFRGGVSTDTCRHCDSLRTELAAALNAKAAHPAVETLRFLAPFIRDAVEADVWKKGMGTESIKQEMEARLGQVERWERGEL